MAVRYDVTGHPLLTGGAEGLGPTELAAQNRVAEILLGLWKFPVFTDADKIDQAKDAVAMQVSYQVQAGVEAFVLSSLIRGNRDMNYRGGRRKMPPIHSAARKIVNTIKPPTV